MRRAGVDGEIERDIERAFNGATVLATAQVSWGLRLSEQTIRLAAKAAGIEPTKVGRTLAWSRGDVHRLLVHLCRRRNGEPRHGSTPHQAA
jgi:hypothetical protein